MTLNTKALGNKIKTIRKRKGITQQTLAELTDCTPTHISYCETGRKNMSLDTLVRIANALNVTTDELLIDSLENTVKVSNHVFTALLKHLVIGGAYSVDKYYRLRLGYGWWEDEQPSPEIKTYVEQQVAEKKFDIVLSHTCPFKYEPTEMFLQGIDQSSVDDSTEHWLDTIEEAIEYRAWFCGHWHVNKRIDKMHFLYHGFESMEPFLEEKENGISPRELKTKENEKRK